MLVKSVRKRAIARKCVFPAEIICVGSGKVAVVGKSILISIKPKWCKLIFERKKSIEVRTRIPLLEPPYKAIVYCTKDGNAEIDGLSLSGKIIGSFDVDAVEPMIRDSYIQGDRFVPKWMQRASCLTGEEIMDYAGYGQAYGMFIKHAFLFDTPKTLPEVGLKRAPQSWCYVEGKILPGGGNDHG